MPRQQILSMKAAASPHGDHDDRRLPVGTAAQKVNVQLMHSVGPVGT